MKWEDKVHGNSGYVFVRRFLDSFSGATMLPRGAEYTGQEDSIRLRFLKC